MAAKFGHKDGRDTVAGAPGIGAARQQQRRDVDVQWFASLRVAVYLYVDRVAQQRPSVPRILLDVVARIEQLAKADEIFEFDRVMRC
jgi:hypothetical protein